MEATVFIILHWNRFRNARSFENWGIYYNPPISFRAILLATLRHVADSYHAITPV